MSRSSRISGFLCWHEDSFSFNEEEDIIYSSGNQGSRILIKSYLSGYPFKRSVEAAGEKYQTILRLLSGESLGSYDSREEESVPKEEEAKYEQKRHKRDDMAKFLEDPYEILGLGHLRWRATEEDIKQTYRKLVLTYHPDKNEGVEDEMFKKIQDAYNIISDPKKRRVFDSQEPFDDSIPSVNEQGNFFDIYGPAFKRFAKWSENPDVPSIGDMNTPYEEVLEFYEFWFSFKSWRDYSYLNEFDPNEAETREEKRWMERQNERELKKKKKEESQKIFRLTENAEKNDPRIKRHKEEQKLQREKAKQAKQEATRKKQEELQKQAELERLRKEEEERKKAEEWAILQKQLQQDNKRKTKLRSKLRRLLAETLTPPPSATDIEILCSKLSLDKLQSLVDTLEKGDTSQVQTAVTTELEAIKKEDKEKEQAKLQAMKKDEPTKPWSADELALLAQAVAKFPGGVTDRWEKISQYVGTRTVKEIITKTKETKFVATKPVSEDAFQRFTKTKKKADKEISSDLSVRDQQDVSTPSSQQQQQSEKEEGPDEKAVQDWTVQDQRALEKALQTFPSSLTDRWDKIAAAVPGKTKKDCIQRYKFICAKIKQKKST